MLVQDTVLLVLYQGIVLYQLQVNHKQMYCLPLNPLRSLEPAELIDNIRFAFRVKMQIQGNPHIHQLMSLKNYSSGIHNPNAQLPLQKHVINA